MQWVRPDATPEQLRADLSECDQRAAYEARLSSWRYQGAMAPVFARDASGRGFFVWPSTSLVDPYGNQLMEERRLAQFCMEAKGYDLVPVPKP